MSTFKNYHPGGYFPIYQSRSRDVSKFYHGGYQMNGSALATTKPHTHSNFSVLSANRMVIGKYEYNAPQ